MSTTNKPHNKQLREFKVENLIKEAITLALFEQRQRLQEADPNMLMPPPQQNINPVPPPPAPPPPDQNEPPPGAGQQPPGQQQFTVDAMIERLNIIRGGRSFTDPEIYGQLVGYFKKLNPEQLQTIEAYLQELVKIVVNVEQQDQQQSPDQQQQTPTMQGGGNPQAPISAPSQAAPQAPMGGGSSSMPSM